MVNKNTMQKDSIESEKVLEQKLNDGVKKLGGWSLKLLTVYMNGLPDRICLIPPGRVFFAEIKTTKKKPKGIQLLVHKQLRKMGFRVEVIDKSNQIESILQDYE